MRYYRRLFLCTNMHTYSRVLRSCISTIYKLKKADMYINNMANYRDTGSISTDNLLQSSFKRNLILDNINLQ